MSERDRMLRGEPYDPADAGLVEARMRAHELCLELNASSAREVAYRRGLLARLFGSGGGGVEVRGPFFCDYGFNIHAGEGVFFNFNCTVLDVCEVRIGDHCLFGPGVQIMTPLHPLDPLARRGAECGRPVAIDADVWVGGGVQILAGVHIGAGAVVGAGSVVTRDLPARTLAFGNPCRPVRAL